MAENSKIEWCDHTVNLWHGCAKVHTGCKNCYAETASRRWGGQLWGEKRHRKEIKSAFRDLAKYERIGRKTGIPQVVFCGSMMDIFEDSKSLTAETSDAAGFSTHDLRYRLFSEIQDKNYENIIFLFLTKRPQNISRCVPVEWQMFGAPRNVWFGTSASDQATYNEYAAALLVHTFSENLFLSIEPQVGRIDIKTIKNPRIKWIIQGGESGRSKRPFDTSWARDMRRDCEALDVAYFFKQIDKVQSVPEELNIREIPFLK